MMLEPTEPVASIVRAMHDEVIQQFALTKRISHPAESGRAREEILQRFLRKFVPKGLGIDTGFVVDSHGGKSRQVDIVIYRDNYHPVLEIGGLKHFLVESVIAAIETKARITTRAMLRDALDSVRSVKALDKSASGRNYIVVDFHIQGSRVGEHPRNEVWTGIVAEQSVSPSTFLDEIEQDMTDHDVSQWLNCYVAVHRFVSRYLNEENQLVWYPKDAHAVALTNPDSKGGEKPLVDFAFLLAHQLRHSAVIDYTPEYYFPMSNTHRSSVHVPGAHSPVDQ